MHLAKSRKTCERYDVTPSHIFTSSDLTHGAIQEFLGHRYEVPNLLLNGTLKSLIKERPELKYLLLHNIDTLGVDLDPGLLGTHIQSGAGMTGEVIARRLEDRRSPWRGAGPG